MEIMDCMDCGLRPATVHDYDVRARKQREFCERCAIADSLISGEKRLTQAMLQRLEELQLPILDLRTRIQRLLDEE